MPDIVFERLSPHGGRRGRPPGVGKWINLADPGDIIAVPLGGISAKFKHVTADLTDAISVFVSIRSLSICAAVQPQEFSPRTCSGNSEHARTGGAARGIRSTDSEAWASPGANNSSENVAL